MARTIVLADANDLAGLVVLQEQAVVLASELAAGDSASLAELARRIASLAEAIVLRTAPDADAAFIEIGKVIDRLAESATAPEAGANPEPVSADDQGLIAAWITGCDGMLTDLEDRLLALERTPTDGEVIADIRRTMHTLKGECGVLSLHTAQKLCHEAETLLDLCVETKRPIPIDPFLLLLDWLRAYTGRLSADHAAVPTGHAEVMDAIHRAQETQQEQAAPAAPIQAAHPQPLRADEPAAAPTPMPAATGSDATPVQFSPQPGTEENLADFLCEARDHLAGSEEALLSLEHDRGNVELINTVFRAFHTIKGVAGFMGLKPIVQLAHSAEQMLDGARSGAVALGRVELDVVLASCDMMTRLLGVLNGSAGPSWGELHALIARLDGAGNAGGAAVVAAAEPPSAPAASPKEASSATAIPAAATVPSPGVQAVRTPAPSEVDATQRTRKSDQTVKVSTTRMDSLVTMVGELMIAQQMVEQDLSAVGESNLRVQRTLGHMSKMIRELQEVSMSLRMVNLKGTFQKMTRLVRDVSQKAGKQIEVVTEGEDVELDRNVVEAITDPLVHMIRNACDHGVEGPDDRAAAGKPRLGRIVLRAYHAGGAIVIEIADDGRGLRREKLLAKARSKGLLPAERADGEMSDSEVFSLIFLPGFSTAEKVTDISGRGVGMDVVRRNIEALRGKVEIRSTPGSGTTFLMRLPLTMAIIDGMVVRVGGQRYVVPTLSIQQSFRPTASDVKTVVELGEMVNVRGSLLPVYRLARVLELNEGHREIAQGLLIVMETHESRFCLMVDEILGQHSVVIKTLTQTGQPLKGVSGGAILGDGRVALILDVAQLAELATDSPKTRPQRRNESDAQALNAGAAA